MKLIFFIDEKGKCPILTCHNLTSEVVLVHAKEETKTKLSRIVAANKEFKELEITFEPKIRLGFLGLDWIR